MYVSSCLYFPLWILIIIWCKSWPSYSIPSLHIDILIYLLGLRWVSTAAWAFSSFSEWGYSPLQGRGSSWYGARLCTWAQKLQHAGPGAQAREWWHVGVVTPQYGGIFPDRGSNRGPCIARWILQRWTTREAFSLFWDVWLSVSLSLSEFC